MRTRTSAKLFALTLLAALLAPAAARAESKLAVVGSGTRTEFRQDNDFPLEVSDEKGWGAGMLFSAALNPMFDLELGAIYGRTIFVDRQGGAFGIPDEIWALRLPLVGRVWLVDWFSLGLGPFYSISLTDEARDDYGLTFSAAFKVPFSKDFGLRLDGRYNAGFKDLTSDTPGFLASAGLEVLAGFEFTL